MTWTRHKGEGDAPTARSGHSAVAYGNHLYIFGGYDSRKYYNDVHVLDVGTLLFAQLH
jgi:N-acetylneuraminic acid mutarotase